MKRVVLIAFVVVAIGCSSSDYDDRPQRGGYGGGDRGGAPMQARGGAGIAELMLPDDWWHDPRLTPTVNLTADQVTQLDNIARGRVDEITKLERDSATALRDLRTTLDNDKVANGDIVTAANRVRTLRNDLFDRQVEVLAAERTVLSKQQWDSLQQALRESRAERRDERRGGYGGRGGRGGFPGGGRRPGWPY